MMIGNFLLNVCLRLEISCKLNMVPSVINRQQVAPDPGGGAGYNDKNLPPAGASSSHGNGDVLRSEEESSTGMYHL